MPSYYFTLLRVIALKQATYAVSLARPIYNYSCIYVPYKFFGYCHVLTNHNLIIKRFLLFLSLEISEVVLYVAIARSNELRCSRPLIGPLRHPHANWSYNTCILYQSVIISFYIYLLAHNHTYNLIAIVISCCSTSRSHVVLVKVFLTIMRIQNEPNIVLLLTLALYKHVLLMSWFYTPEFVYKKYRTIIFLIIVRGFNRLIKNVSN